MPVLLGPLGEPVVAYWESPDRSQRWYVVPAGIEWKTVVDWLVRQLLPELLKNAVAAVLDAAGCQVVDLDEALGGTRSADLLVTHAGNNRLVEVKASVGRPGEHLVADLRRHLETWPELGQANPVADGTLVINHDHRLAPAERPREAYTRPEFVAALTVEVVSSRAMYDLWCAEDWTSIRNLMFGNTTPPPAAAAAALATPAAKAPRWRLQRRQSRE